MAELLVYYPLWREILREVHSQDKINKRQTLLPSVYLLLLPLYIEFRIKHSQKVSTEDVKIHFIAVGLLIYNYDNIRHLWPLSFEPLKVI